MAYGGRPVLKGWQKAVLSIYAILVLISAPVLLVFSIVSGCPAFSGDCVPATQIEQFMFFPGALLVEVAGGLLLYKSFARPTR
jgi:hypothetical protein